MASESEVTSEIRFGLASWEVGHEVTEPSFSHDAVFEQELRKVAEQKYDEAWYRVIVNEVRTTAEQNLKLRSGYFRENWRDRSDAIVRDEVDKQEMAKRKAAAYDAMSAVEEAEDVDPLEDNTSSEDEGVDSDDSSNPYQAADLEFNRAKAWRRKNRNALERRNPQKVQREIAVRIALYERTGNIGWVMVGKKEKKKKYEDLIEAQEAKVVKLKKYLAQCGVKKNWKVALQRCADVEAEIEALQKELTKVGFVAPVSKDNQGARGWKEERRQIKGVGKAKRKEAKAIRRRDRSALELEAELKDVQEESGDFAAEVQRLERRGVKRNARGLPVSETANIIFDLDEEEEPPRQRAKLAHTDATLQDEEDGEEVGEDEEGEEDGGHDDEENGEQNDDAGGDE